jgi:hypothetical protein
VDYYRAVTHETKWLDQHLLALSEMSEFRARLVDEWKTAFADTVDDLGDDADEAQRAPDGKALLRT